MGTRASDVPDVNESSGAVWARHMPAAEATSLSLEARVEGNRRKFG